MAFKGVLYLYIALLASVSLLSYRKGLYLVWLTLLLFPLVILQTGIKLHLSLMAVLMLGSVISELRFSESRSIYSGFVHNNLRAILLFGLVSLCVAFMSQTVPLGTQLRIVLNEFIAFSFALQTFLLLKRDANAANTLLYIICGVVIFNAIYCTFFELYLRFNPAGAPLYLALGIYDEEYMVDAVESERGGLDLRAQTVYGHPLSLGQYLLVLLPLFLMKSKVWLKSLYVFIITVLVVLSGTRGAMAPMALVLLLGYKDAFKKVLARFPLVLLAVVISFSFLSDRTVKKMSKEVEPYIASLQFWDDQKQKENDIQGSSMEMRIDQFEAAQEEIADNPVFGRGYGYREYWQNKHNTFHPDLLGYESVLIYYLVERGWLGLLFFFAMAFYIYKLFRKETSNGLFIKLIFLGWILSIVMTGVRPLTLLFVCLAGSIVCGVNKLDSHSVVENR